MDIGEERVNTEQLCQKTRKDRTHHHVQFSLENNQTFEFESDDKMEKFDPDDGQTIPNGSTLQGVEDSGKMKNSQREEIKTLNTQLIQFKQQCRKEMAQSKSDKEKKKKEYEHELEELEEQIRNKKNFLENGHKDAQNHILKEDLSKLEVVLKEKEKELSKKSKKLHKYEKKVDELEKKLTNLSRHTPDSQKNVAVHKCPGSEEKGCQTETDILMEYELHELRKNTEYLERHQKMLERESRLLEREEDLSKRQKALEDYEKEIEEIEGYLDRRQAIVERHQKDVDELDRELVLLKDDLNEEKEQLRKQGVNVDSAAQKAKLNWNENHREREFLRRGLVDKQGMLERQLRSCRSDLAESEIKLSTKDNEITQFKKQIETLKQDIDKKDKQIKQLDSHLTITLDEKRREVNNNVTVENTRGSRTSLDRRASVAVTPTRTVADYTFYTQSAGGATEKRRKSIAVSPTMRKTSLTVNTSTPNDSGNRERSPKRSSVRFDESDMGTIHESESSSSTGDNDPFSRSFSGFSTKSEMSGINRQRPSSLKSEQELHKISASNQHTPLGQRNSLPERSNRKVSNTGIVRRANNVDGRDPATTFDYEQSKNLSSTCRLM